MQHAILDIYLHQIAGLQLNYLLISFYKCIMLTDPLKISAPMQLDSMYRMIFFNGAIAGAIITAVATEKPSSETFPNILTHSDFPTFTDFEKVSAKIKCCHWILFLVRIKTFYGTN